MRMSCWWIAIVLLLSFTVTARAEPLTQHDLKKLIYEANRRLIVEAYKTSGERNAKWDDAVIEYLDAESKLQAYGGWEPWYRGPKIPTYEDRVRLGQKALDLGCTDPIVTDRLIAAYFDHGDREKLASLAVQNAPKMLSSKYPAFVKWRAASRWLDSIPNTDGKARRAAQKTLDQLRKDALTEKAFLPSERYVSWVYLRHHWEANSQQSPASIDQKIKEITSIEGADPWLVNTLLADLQIKAAWAIRGGAWAAQVKEENWPKFFERLKLAREAALAAWKIDQSLPQPCVSLITIAMAGGTPKEETIDSWLNNALSAQMDCDEAMEAYLYASLPRWGGSHGDMYDFGVECLKGKRFDTRTPFMLIRAVKSIASDSEFQLPIGTLPNLYANTSDCIDGYLATFSPEKPISDINYDWLLTHKLAAATLTRSDEEVKKIMTQFRKGIHDDVFFALGIWSSRAIPEAYAKTGNFLKQIDAIRKKQADGASMEVLLKDMETLEKEIPADDRTREFIHDTVVRTRARLLFQDKMPGNKIQPAAEDFHLLAGVWGNEPDGSIVATAREGIRAVYRGEMPARFAVEYDLEFLTPPEKNDPRDIYLNPIFKWKGLHYSVRVNRELGTLAVMYEGKAYHDSPFEPKDKYHIRSVTTDQGIRFTVNGRSLLLPKRPETDDWNQYVELGLFPARDGQRIRISNLRIEPAPEEPAPPQAPNNGR